MVEFRSKLDGSKSRALNNRTFKKLLWMYVLLTVLLIVLGVVGIVVGIVASSILFIYLIGLVTSHRQRRGKPTGDR